MNYTYAQMKEMQEQAFERVKEMQKRADITAKQAMQDMSAGTARLPAEPDWARSGAAGTPEEREKALILTLIMLLNAESSNRELELALMYVLNG
ncbi:MAG: hypothetical protein IJ766_01960 [Clostridia bacterium]|nr:hypothetical protein [Clostridia bacterium]